MGVGWVAGLNENITNSAKLGLTSAEFGKIRWGLAGQNSAYTDTVPY